MKFTYVSGVHSVYLLACVPILAVEWERSWGLYWITEQAASTQAPQPPSCSGQSSLALEYSLTHLALACLSIRYVMYPGSTLTSCIALFLLSFLRSPSVPLPLLCASRHVTTQVRKIKERLLRPNLHPYRARASTNENSLPSNRVYFAFPDFRGNFSLNTLS